MTNSIFDTNDALAKMVHGGTPDELLHLIRENPGADDWYDDLILAKKDQIGITDLGMTWGIQITCRSFSHSTTVLTTTHCNQTNSTKTIQHFPVTNTLKQSSLSPLSYLIGTQWNE